MKLRNPVIFKKLSEKTRRPRECLSEYSYDNHFKLIVEYESLHLNIRIYIIDVTEYTEKPELTVYTVYKNI